jgi:flagellar hook-associated protein 3 FlgL
MLRNVSNSFQRMEKYQNQLSTGKKITRPSDDPVVAMKGMTYRTELNQVEQFRRNLSEAYNWMDAADSSLDKATSVLQRIRDLTVQASNGTYEEGQQGMIQKEITQLKEHMASIGNTQVAGKYIFNGNDTKNKPIDLNYSPTPAPDGKETGFKMLDVSILDNNKVSTNQNAVEFELSDGIKIPVNINPTNVFSKQLFKDIEDLETALQNGAPDLDQFLTKIDNHISGIVSERAELGARYNRIELMDSRLSEQEVISSKILSDNEDADIERVITDLKMQESVHRAALAVGSRIIQPSLMDFLR